MLCAVEISIKFGKGILMEMSPELIVQIKFGSHLYGTNTPTSDLEFKSVYIPTARRPCSRLEAGAAQHQLAKTVDKIGSQLVVSDEESHVNGPVE
jgi:hypothetical protein